MVCDVHFAQSIAAPWASFAVVVGTGCAVPPEPLLLVAESTLTEPMDASTESGSTPPLESIGSTSMSSASSSGAGEGTTSGDTGSALSVGTTVGGDESSTGGAIGPMTDGLEESSSTGVACMAPAEVSCDAACCTYVDEICVADACNACPLVDDFDMGVPAWTPNGDWGSYFGAPASPVHAAVPFSSIVYGTDGNRVGGVPEDQEVENSNVMTTAVVLGDELRFNSWHVDQGGQLGLDDKVIEIYVGGRFHTLVACNLGVNPQAFCSEVFGPRAGDDWDIVVLDTSTWSGMNAQFRFHYLSDTADGEFEQGWYVDELRVGSECGSPT